jgi:hypothetical protein
MITGVFLRSPQGGVQLVPQALSHVWLSDRHERNSPGLLVRPCRCLWRCAAAVRHLLVSDPSAPDPASPSLQRSCSAWALACSRGAGEHPQQQMLNLCCGFTLKTMVRLPLAGWHHQHNSSGLAVTRNLSCPS